MGTPPEDRTLPVGEETPATGEVSIRRIQVINLGLLGAAAAGAALFSPGFALGVAVGGVLTAVNFRIIAGVIRSVFLAGSTNLLNVGIYWAKFLGLLVLVGVVVVTFRIDVFGFLVGFSTILVAITVEAVIRLAGR